MFSLITYSFLVHIDTGVCLWYRWKRCTDTCFPTYFRIWWNHSSRLQRRCQPVTNSNIYGNGLTRWTRVPCCTGGMFSTTPSGDISVYLKKNLLWALYCHKFVHSLTFVLVMSLRFTFLRWIRRHTLASNFVFDFSNLYRTHFHVLLFRTKNVMLKSKWNREHVNYNKPD